APVQRHAENRIPAARVRPSLAAHGLWTGAWPPRPLHVSALLKEPSIEAWRGGVRLPWSGPETREKCSCRSGAALHGPHTVCGPDHGRHTPFDVTALHR